MDAPDAAMMTAIATAASAGIGGLYRWLGSKDRALVKELTARVESCETKHAESESKHKERDKREATHAAALASAIDTVVKLRRERLDEDDTGVHQLVEHQQAVLRTVRRSEPHQVAVLLVDDAELERRAVQRVLSAHGFAVIACGSVALALAAMRSHHVDVVVADLLMPGHSGIDLLHAIRHEYPLVPLILISGEADLGHQLAVTESVRFLAKPFTAELLTATITEALEGVV